MAEMVKKPRKKEETNEQLVQEENLFGMDLSDENQDNINELEKDNEVERLKKENAEKDEKIEKLSKEFEELKRMLMQKTEPVVKTETNYVNDYNDNDDVLIGCRTFSPTPLATGDGRICIIFNGSEQKYVSVDELKELFRNTPVKDNRKLFETGIFYFVDDKNYERFKIRKKVNLSHDEVKKIILINNTNDMIREVNRISNNLIDTNVLHIFKYTIVEMLTSNKNELKDWSYDSRHELEKYLKIKFDDLIINSRVLDFLKENRG